MKYKKEINALNKEIESLKNFLAIEGMEFFTNQQIDCLTKLKEEVFYNYRKIEDYGVTLEYFLKRVNITVEEEVFSTIDSLRYRLEIKLEKTNIIEYRKLKKELKEGI